MRINQSECELQLEKVKIKMCCSMVCGQATLGVLTRIVLDADIVAMAIFVVIPDGFLWPALHQW